MDILLVVVVFVAVIVIINIGLNVAHNNFLRGRKDIDG